MHKELWSYKREYVTLKFPNGKWEMHQLTSLLPLGITHMSRKAKNWTDKSYSAQFLYICFRDSNCYPSETQATTRSDKATNISHHLYTKCIFITKVVYTLHQLTQNPKYTFAQTLHITRLNIYIKKSIQEKQKGDRIYYI